MSALVRDRGWRRALAERKKRRVVRKNYHSFGALWTPALVGKTATTPQRCSCEMGCGNRRRHEGPTVQEKRRGEDA